MRRAAKVDSNQQEIVRQLRAIGATVQPLHMVGKGCPDLLIGWRGKNYLVELKDGSLVPSARQLTPDEKQWHSKWTGQVMVAETFEQIVNLLME